MMRFVSRLNGGDIELVAAGAALAAVVMVVVGLAIVFGVSFPH